MGHYLTKNSFNHSSRDTAIRASTSPDDCSVALTIARLRCPRNTTYACSQRTDAVFVGNIDRTSRSGSAPLSGVIRGPIC
jgi:hypothetical protein